MENDWDPADFQTIECVQIGGFEVRRGATVRLRPRRRADIMDIALAGKLAVVDAIEQDYERHLHLAVVVVDDPGADLGLARQIGHRFFFGVDEVEPLADADERQGR